MTIVSSKEFVGNQEKYFDMAVCEDVFIKKDELFEGIYEDIAKRFTKNER